VGEIETFRVLEIRPAKWYKEHIPRKGNNLHDITEEGISLLEDTELWWEKQTYYGHTTLQDRRTERIKTDPW
jgi:hypothetical protein